MKKKIIHLNHSDNKGGAARACYRIHQSLLSSGTVDSEMWVNQVNSSDPTVTGPNSMLDKFLARIRPHIVKPLIKMLKTQNPIIHSPQILPSNWVKKINDSDADIIHLHWVQGEMLSIADIGRIKKPLVWTLHDMWAFCGAEHLAWDDRWRDGYQHPNRPLHETGFDINLWSWRRKQRFWRKKIKIITPSRWLTKCVKDSFLMHNWPVSVIPNPIDTNLWKPTEKKLARDKLGLPINAPLILFGALGGAHDFHKGFDLLLKAVHKLSDDPNMKNLELVVFGQDAPKSSPLVAFPIHYMGHLEDDFKLSMLYSAVDVMVVPSRQETFGQTASEAQTCETPVVAFNIGGLADIVIHKKTGYLAKSFDTQDLATGITWVLEHRKDNQLGKLGRKESINRFSSEIVSTQYEKIYDQTL